MKKLAALGLAAVLLAGCGGSNEPAASNEATRSTTPSEPSISKGEYITRLDALCKRGKAAADRDNARLQQIIKPGTSVAYVRGADFMDGQLPKERELLREAEAVPVPAGDSAAVEAYLRPVRDGQTVARLISDALRDGDAPRVASLSTESEGLRDRRRGAAEAYGFKTCGRS